MSELKALHGRITARIEDKNGNVKQECSVDNTITNAFLKQSLFSALQHGTAGTVLRAVSKPTTGQYASAAQTGNFGIYALNKQIDITGDTVIPPYVSPDLESLDPSVAFYNTANTLVESAQVMLAVDNRSTYRRTLGDNSYVVEYVKNSGVGSVQSVCIGREHSTPSAVTGLLLGEAIYQPIWTTGTDDYFLEHFTTGTPTELCPFGNQQGTIVWKRVDTSSQFSANLVTKQVTTYSNSLLSANISNTNLTGGHIFTDGSGKKIAIKAVHSEQTEDSVVLSLNFNTDILNTTDVQTRIITIPAPEPPNLDPHQPIMVSRPDIGTLEILTAISHGTEYEHDPPHTCRNAWISIDDPTDPGNSNIEITDTLNVPYGIGAYNSTEVGHYVSGLCFADLQNNDAAKSDKPENDREPAYYFPYLYDQTSSDGYAISNTSFTPGITFPGGRFWLAKTLTAQQFNAPVITDAGVMHCRVNSAGMYYPTLSGVISGSNLPQTLTKSSDDVLRIIYEYSFT